MLLPPLTLVIGGAASGKSAYAEAAIRACGLEKTYVATAQAFDDEMAEKIAAHRAARSVDGWDTLEAPLEVAVALQGIAPGRAILVDCLTLWLSNLVLAGRDVPAAIDALLDTIGAVTGPVIVVSNEVGAGIVPETTLGRAFRGIQGRANQRLAAQADCVVQVTAGLPMPLKGSLPAGVP